METQNNQGILHRWTLRKFVTIRATYEVTERRRRGGSKWETEDGVKWGAIKIIWQISDRRRVLDPTCKCNRVFAFLVRLWLLGLTLGRISAERNHVHYDVSPVMHTFLRVSGLMLQCT